MSASYPTKVFLAMKSGNVCAFNDCRKMLTSGGANSNPAVIGEAAHIYGESPGTKTKPASARYQKDMADTQRNHYENLIYQTVRKTPYFEVGDVSTSAIAD